jgi:hypothetical protein
MRRLIVPAVLWMLAVAALLTGIALVGIGQWSRPLLDAEQAGKSGELERALAQFGEGEARFNRMPIVKQLLPAAYDSSVGNQLALLYRLKRYDDLIDKAATSPSNAATHFWAGCALFQKAQLEQASDARLAFLGRAEAEFRSTLEADPNDWDAKYNYELTRRAVDQARKQPQAAPKQRLQMLRPQPTGSAEPGKRVG